MRVREYKTLSARSAQENSEGVTSATSSYLNNACKDMFEGGPRGDGIIVEIHICESKIELDL